MISIPIDLANFPDDQWISVSFLVKKSKIATTDPMDDGLFSDVQFDKATATVLENEAT